MPTYQFISPRTGSTYNVDFDNDPNDADLEEARSDLDMREQQTGQNLFQATTGEMARSALSVPKGIVGGAGAITSLVPGMEDNFLQRGAESFQEGYEDVIPVDPALQESFPVKASSAVGQGAGMLATTLLTGGLGATPAVARAVGLGTAGLMGAEQGEATAEQYGLTDPLERAAMVLGGAATEAGTEAFGGFGGKNFTEALLGRMKSATRPGTAITRGLKTVGSEGLEEMVAGQAQDWLTGGIVDEDPNRPGFALNGAALPPDTLTMENLYNRLEEGALGAIGGAVFAGAEAAGSRTQVDEALSLRMQARTILDELQAKETLTPEEQAQLVQMEAEDQNIGAWLERKGFESVRPALEQIINDPEAPEDQRIEAVQYASLIDNLAAVEAAPDAPPEEVQEAREAVSNHPLNQRENRLAKSNQDLSIKGAWEDRKTALQKQVQQAVQRQQGGLPVAPEVDPLEATINQSTQDLVETAPQTAAAIEVLNTELPTQSADVTPDQTGSTASYTPATAQAAASMGVQSEATETPDQILDPALPTQVTPNETPSQVQEQQALSLDAGQQAPLAVSPPSSVTGGVGESVGTMPDTTAQLTINQKPVRKPKVRLGIAVSPREVQRAVKKFQKISSFRIATIEELAEDENVRSLFETDEQWQDFLQNRLPFAEGLSHDGSGNIVIIPENLAIYDADQARAKKLGTTAGEEAMIRVMMHEGWHGAERWIEQSGEPEAVALRDRYYDILNQITEQELDDLAQRRYTEFSNWREDPMSKRFLQSEVLAERRELAELTGEPDSLVEKFLAWLRDVLKTVTGTQAEPTPDELQELFNAWYRAQKATQTRAGPVQQSLPEGIPPRPNVPVTYEDRGTGNTLDEVLDSIWPQFYTAWVSRQQEAGLPLDQRQLAKEWAERVSDPDYLFDKDIDLRIQKKNANRNWMGIQLPPRELTTPETGPRQTKRRASKTPEPTKEDIMRRFPQMSLPEMTPEERKARLAEIADRLSYTPSVEEQEGMSPVKATEKKRKYATDGSDVELYREGVTGAEIDQLSNEALAHAISLSPDGPSQDFGKELVKYLNGQIPTLNGLPNNQFLKAAIALNLEHSPLQRNQMGIDSQDLRKATQQILSVAGRTLKAASQGRLYEPLRKMQEKAEEMTSKEAKSEIGTDDFKSISDAGNEAKVKEVKEAVDDLMPNMPVILEAAQNDADATDLFELGMEGIDPKLAKKITELNERVERLGRLRQMRARMTAGSAGPAASLPEIPANMTLAELDKLIAEEEAAIKKLVDEVDKAQKKAAAKPRAKKDKKVTNNATFTEYVEGKETAGLPPFVDLVKKYVQADSFNSDAFSTLLANSFKQADPLFIQGVVRRISEALDGSATEEGIQDDLKKAVNYDARAKRIVATEIAQGSTDAQEEESKPDPFTELTKQRLKGELSAKAYQEGLRKLGVEEQTAYAMLQKVDQDRARMADAQAARKVGSEARKNMEKSVKDAEREAQKYEKEALREIESTSKQFDENAPDKEQKKSELKKLKDSFLGKSGPPISEEQFIEGARALNIKPETAQKLATWLNASRRADAMERYQKALQKAQKAKEKAIEAMVKKLDKVQNPTPQKLKKRSKFLNLVQEGMNSGILDSELVRAAFAQAYDLHGLTPERLKDMADLMNQIESLPNSMEKETFYLRFQQLLNEIAPASSISSMAFSAYMGYVLQGAGTMIAQTSNLANFLTPLAFAHSFGQIYATTQGPPLKKMLTALSVRRNWNMAVAGMKESWGNLGLIRAGLSGIATSTGQGLGVTPVELTQTPYETSLAWTPWGQVSDFRMKSNKLMESMGVLKLFKATKLPAWVASRSFQVIRGAEGWSGGVEKNMAFRRVAVAELQKQGKSYDEAWRMVDEALTGKSNKQMWDEAYAKADELIKEGTVNKAARLQKATELVQDMLDEKWNLTLANRHRQQSAMANFKTDPLTPLGAGAYGFVARALENNHWGPFPNPLRFGFLFPRFFINSMEQGYMYSPVGLLTSIGLPTSLPDAKMKERQQRIVEIYGSLENYKQQRLGKGFTGTALLTGIGGLMATAMQMWDGDDDEPPAFWLTGDVIGRYDKRGILSETGWWAPNTMYIMGMKFNYVNASPQFGMILNAAGNIGDRYMFPELLGTKYDARTKQHEKSFAETWVRPVGEATAAPMSRSTYRVFYDALDNAMGGDFKKLIRLITQPATGSATALTLGVVPSLKTFEKAEKSSIQPRSPQDVSQTLQAAVPFGNSLGFDTGKPLYSPFGEALTPYNFFTFLSNSQEATEDSKRAAKILIDLGVSKQPPKLEYLGDGVVEVAHDGKFYLLPPEQRNDLILLMGQELARTIVREKATLQKLEKEKGRDAVSDKVGTYAADARKKVLRGFKPEK